VGGGGRRWKCWLDATASRPDTEGLAPSAPPDSTLVDKAPTSSCRQSQLTARTEERAAPGSLAPLGRWSIATAPFSISRPCGSRRPAPEAELLALIEVSRRRAG